jgi:hypothetical protein
MERQRSLQKGKSGEPDVAGFLQIGQRSLGGRLLGMGSLAEAKGQIVLKRLGAVRFSLLL